MKFKFFKFLKKQQSLDYGKIFSSYKKAKNYSNNVGVYFDKRFTKFEGPNEVNIADRFYIASVLPSLFKKKKLNILDFGGGPNPIYSYIKKTTNISTKCYVIDTEKLVKIIEKKIPKKYKSDVKYISSIDKLKIKSFDIVYFNSSMQYLENYEYILKKISKFKPCYILISYTPMSLKNKNSYTVQYGVPGSIHPIIFFSSLKLKKLLLKLKYKMIYENKYMNIIKKNKNSDLNSFYYGDLLFSKN